MADDFVKAVEDGLKLSKRLYFGKDRAVLPPKPLPAMDKSASADLYMPTAPMVYAVIQDPKIVDNPDIPSYQPHVHGRCDPPALIPLQMNRVDLEVDCYLDTAFIRVSGSWRVHCVMGSKSCDCRIAIPMGEEGSILGVEVEVSGKSYSTRLIAMGDNKDVEKGVRPEHGGFLKPHIFTLTIPQIDGGCNLSIKLCWSQKLSYCDGLFSLNVPFKFPEYVNPTIKKLPRKEKILLNVNTGTGTEVLCKTTSHPLKQLRRDVGKLGFSYEAEVLKWSSTDFTFSYSVSASHIFGGVLLQSPSTHDFDQREMFCVYLFPGSQQSRKVFRKDVVFVVDISGSMQGKPLEDTKTALSTALSKLDQGDSFNIIAFNGETYLFSTSMELATQEAVERASQWISINFIAGGSTNISVPLTKAVEMLTNTRGSIPIIFLVTDGAVEDDRHICDLMKSRLTNGGSICPRIYSLGIGSYCNHYFLRMIATISRGQYDAAYDLDSIEFRMQKLFTRGLSTVLTDITIDTLKDLDEFEMYPSRLPDLSSESPLTISGRYQGKFPDTLKANGVSGDLSNVVVELKIQNAKDIPLDRVFAKQQIDLLTAQAWFSEDKQLVEKVAKMSVQTNIISEYTRMVILETKTVEENSFTESSAKKASKKNDTQKIVDSEVPKTIFLQSLSLHIGFGDLTATAENIPPGYEGPKLPEAAEIFVKAASTCCSSLFNKCCCICGIQCCSKLNDQFVVVLTQLCTGLACFGCFECFSNLCCCGQDGQ
ncbi:hypothetical protein JRO89_XS04G0191100 [Xanthoceras sorbifolium]|uniref:VWFA domain-containing protein n=1 Tax=Xanthoceras sorbifolium TaxID=99658 RepID=A0ABQ8I6H0_9ROSI|nr:hypothetical protein JRO89_XS04G0191100 [Xanthoceras sorbifolium]